MSDYNYEAFFIEKDDINEKAYKRRNSFKRELKSCIDTICLKSMKRLERPLTLAEMEQITGYSKRSLITAFHARFGCSPCKWQQSERLRYAHAYLSTCETKVRIAKLAMALGFPSSSKFGSYYRRMFNETPRQTLRRFYRKTA